MANVRYIEKTYIETEQFNDSQEDITLRIQLADGEQVLFTAQKEFYTPRRIATNKSDVLELDNVVEYTPNNVPIIKIQNGQVELNKPQYYVNSIVRDVYKQYKLDNFFTELDDELSVPDFEGTEAEQRQFALNALINLEDLSAAAVAGDFQAAQEAAAEIDNNFSELAGFENIRQVSPSEITTPQEEDQLTALDFVGLTTAPGSIPGEYTGSPSDTIPTSNAITDANGNVVASGPGTVIRTGPGPNDFYVVDDGVTSQIPPESAMSDLGGLFASADTSDDIIDPLPSVQENSLIKVGNGIASFAGTVPGIDTINNAISSLNVGIQQVEGLMQGTGDQDMITVAPGKKAFASSGGQTNGISPERQIPKSAVDKRLADIKDDIATQERTPYTLLETLSGVPSLVINGRVETFNKLIKNLDTAGSLASIKKCLAHPEIMARVKGGESKVKIPNGFRVMTKENLLYLLNKTKEELEKTMSQG